MNISRRTGIVHSGVRESPYGVSRPLLAFAVLGISRMLSSAGAYRPLLEVPVPQGGFDCRRAQRSKSQMN